MRFATNAQFTGLDFVDYDGYLRFLVFEHSVGNARLRTWVEGELQRLASKEQQVRDAAIESERLTLEGASIDEAVDIIPAAHSSFRDPQINKFSDYDPGDAETIFKILVR